MNNSQKNMACYSLRHSSKRYLIQKSSVISSSFFHLHPQKPINCKGILTKVSKSFPTFATQEPIFLNPASSLLTLNMSILPINCFTIIISQIKCLLGDIYAKIQFFIHIINILEFNGIKKEWW